MTLKLLGNKLGGWIIISNFRVKYYFYYVKENMGKGKVHARVVANG